MRANLIKIGPKNFVGQLDARRIKDLHEWLHQSGRSATLIVQSRRAPMGLRVQTYGADADRWLVVEVDGVPLIGNRRPEKSTS